jgi:hypothetical protein
MFVRIASTAALAACASMASVPLAASELPRIAAQGAGVFDANAVNAQNHRRWRRDRVDAGDVIGGLLVIGTIAAVASAASKASRNDRYRDRDYRSDYRGRAYGSSWQEGRGLDQAVGICAREVERNARIDTIDGANRTGTGWDVSGRLRTGESFRCTLGHDGRIDSVDYGRGLGYRGAVSDGQWSNERYAAARSSQETSGAFEPAYPGGPVPGETTTSDTDSNF